VKLFLTFIKVGMWHLKVTYVSSTYTVCIWVLPMFTGYNT